MHKYRILRLIIAFCCLAAFGANAQVTPPPAAQKLNSTSVLDTDKFVIAIPTGWQHFTRQSSGFNILFLMAPQANNFNPNLNLLSENVSGATLDEYVEANKQNMSKSNMVFDSEGDITISGIKAKYTTSHFNYQGTDIATKTYFVIKNGLAYVLTGSCLPTQKDTYRPIFDATVQTFKIK